MSRNRLANTRNHFQGDYKRVLCVCSAGLLRSPTTALVLSQEPFNYNTRAVGIVEEYALIMVDSAHLYWAQEIVCMEEEHKKQIEFNLKRMELDTPVICLNVPDDFMYRDPKLMELIREAYQKATAGNRTEENGKAPEETGTTGEAETEKGTDPTEGHSVDKDFVR